VPSEYLFELQPHIGFPLGDELEFRKCMESENVCVDFLLERIFIAAQNLAINQAEVLFPVDQAKDVAVQPTPQQVQQLMFQCVTYAALLIVCYVAGEWDLPEGKVGLILSTILRTNSSRFASTQSTMGKVEALLMELLAIKKEE
jgi:hypothetical protein